MGKIRFDRDGDRIVIASAKRLPIGQAGKSYAGVHSYMLGAHVAEQVIKDSGINRDEIDGVVCGEIGQSSKAPNAARVISVKLGLPLGGTAITVANNCVSGFEAVNEAARRIIMGENDVILVIGEESMSNSPIYLDNVRRNAKTANVAKIKKNWSELGNMIEEGSVAVVDGVEEGLNDPIRDAMMFATAEIVAQKLGLTRKELDDYAHGSYKKAYDAIEAGAYDKYIVKYDKDGVDLEKDEYIMSKAGFAEKRERFDKAPVIYENMPGGLEGLYDKFGEFIGKSYDDSKEAVVTLFNACPQSDGAGALIMTTESKAKELGLEVQAIVKSWGYKGVDPAIMGLGIAYAMKEALNNAELNWDDVGAFEIHEAFAATAYGSMVVSRDELGGDLVKKLEEGKVNPHGGTLAMGHPLGATGVRVAINQLMDLDKFPDAKYVMGSICAGGGVGGALILERP